MLCLCLCGLWIVGGGADATFSGVAALCLGDLMSPGRYGTLRGDAGGVE